MAIWSQISEVGSADKLFGGPMPLCRVARNAGDGDVAPVVGAASAKRRHVVGLELSEKRRFAVGAHPVLRFCHRPKFIKGVRADSFALAGATMGCADSSVDVGLLFIGFAPRTSKVRVEASSGEVVLGAIFGVIHEPLPIHSQLVFSVGPILSFGVVGYTCLTQRAYAIVAASVFVKLGNRFGFLAAVAPLILWIRCGHVHSLVRRSPVGVDAPRRGIVYFPHFTAHFGAMRGGQ